MKINTKIDQYYIVLARFLLRHGGHWRGRATRLLSEILSDGDRYCRIVKPHPIGLGRAIRYHLPDLMQIVRMHTPSEYIGRTIYIFYGLSDIARQWQSRQWRDYFDITTESGKANPAPYPLGEVDQTNDHHKRSAMVCDGDRQRPRPRHRPAHDLAIVLATTSTSVEATATARGHGQMHSKAV